mgnify:CR=1 FL=1
MALASTATTGRRIRLLGSSTTRRIRRAFGTTMSWQYSRAGTACSGWGPTAGSRGGTRSPGTLPAKGCGRATCAVSTPTPSRRLPSRQRERCGWAPMGAASAAARPPQTQGSRGCRTRPTGPSPVRRPTSCPSPSTSLGASGSERSAACTSGIRARDDLRASARRTAVRKTK